MDSTIAKNNHIYNLQSCICKNDAPDHPSIHHLQLFSQEHMEASVHSWLVSSAPIIIFGSQAT